MKKTVSLLFLLCLSTSEIRSQTWCPPGAVWNFTVHGGDPAVAHRGYTEIRNLGKEVVDGKNCDKLSYYGYRKWGPDSYPCCDPVYKHIYTYLENGVVYFRLRPNHFDTLVNFNSGLWKGWTVNFYDSVSCPDAYPAMTRYTVVDTGHAMINGFNLKYVSVFPCDTAAVANYTLSSYRIYERIGPTRDFLTPYVWGCKNVTDSWAHEGQFTCYWDDNFAPYKNPVYNTCNYNKVGIEESNGNVWYSAFPNPVHDKLNLHLSQAGKVRVYSGCGQLIIEFDAEPFVSKSIDFSDREPGLYFLWS